MSTRKPIRLGMNPFSGQIHAVPNWKPYGDGNGFEAIGERLDVTADFMHIAEQEMGLRHPPTRSQLAQIKKTDGLRMDGSQAYRHLDSGFIDALIEARYAREDDPPPMGAHATGTCATCGIPTIMHSRGADYFCCECYVKAGNPPADWHDDCMKAFELMEGVGL